MPLAKGYGVVIGTQHRYFRDPVNDYGQYFHGNLVVQTPSGRFHCAIDVDSKSLPNGVQWKVVELDPSALKGVDALTPGWHVLASTPESGALDYLRSRDLRPRRSGCAVGPLARVLAAVGVRGRELPWRAGTSIDALGDLEPLLTAPRRVLVFGEPFRPPDLGVHNIHQNQGDPIGSQWSAENGIWQDGATVVQRPDGSYAAFCNKFRTQADRTDDDGRPVVSRSPARWP
ncbi:MAG TPA: YukJ family protein [Jiangellales bacterium]|nr:YukJ family protein [Jiangellales bacterium]